MSEKIAITIDTNVIVAEGEEKVFENQYIQLEAGIKCNGTLIFKNCTIEPSSDLNNDSSKKRVRAGSTRPDDILRTHCISVGVNEKLEMDGCEINPSRQRFSVGLDYDGKGYIIPFGFTI